MDAALESAKPHAPTGAGAHAADGNMVFRVFKFAAALALLPLCAGMTLGASDYLSSLNHGLPFFFKWCGWGALSFGVFAILLWRPVVVYVFGHELMHALAAWLCLGTVSNLSASASGGQVTTSKSNTLIRLAPYCVPLYALVATLIYALLNAFWRPLGLYFHWCAFALGFFYTFHLGFTLWSVRRDQPDFKQDGWLFSLVLIYLSNLAFAMLMMGFLFRGDIKQSWPALRDTSVAGWRHSGAIYHDLSSAAQRALQRNGAARAEIETQNPE